MPKPSTWIGLASFQLEPFSLDSSQTGFGITTMFYTQSSDKSKISLCLTFAALLSASTAFNGTVLDSSKNNFQHTQSLSRQEIFTLSKAFSGTNIELHSKVPSSISSQNQTKDSVLNLAKVLPDNDDSITPTTPSTSSGA
jgi:hypothetical protein